MGHIGNEVIGVIASKSGLEGIKDGDVSFQRVSKVAIGMDVAGALIEDGKLRARSALDGDHVAVLDGEAKSGGGNVLTVDAASA